MTSPVRLDPLAFAGSFAYLASDIPPGVTLAVWRSQRCSPDPLQAATGLSEVGRRQRGPRAPGSHPAGAREGASAAQRARLQPEENQ